MVNKYKTYILSINEKVINIIFKIRT